MDSGPSSSNISSRRFGGPSLHLWSHPKRRWRALSMCAVWLGARCFSGILRQGEAPEVGEGGAGGALGEPPKVGRGGGVGVGPRPRGPGATEAAGSLNICFGLGGDSEQPRASAPAARSEQPRAAVRSLRHRPAERSEQPPRTRAASATSAPRLRPLPRQPASSERRRPMGEAPHSARAEWATGLWFERPAPSTHAGPPCTRACRCVPAMGGAGAVWMHLPGQLRQLWPGPLRTSTLRSKSLRGNMTSPSRLEERAARYAQEADAPLELAGGR